MPEPSKIPEAWAVAGDYNTIPSADPGNGLASWDMGFPVETQTPLAAGGVPPRRQDINGALYWLSTAQLWYQQGGLWQYDASENYEIGNVVEQNNAMYYCKAANGPNSTVKSPSADTAGTYWKKLVNSDGTLNVPVISNASTTVTGIVELATSAETKALTDATRAVTPSSLNGLLSLSPAALTVPKADSSGKLTGWLNALKDNDGKVNISIKGTAPTLQTARTVRVNLASTSTASFDGSTNITPGVTGVLPISNGGTGSSTKNFVDLTTVQTISAKKSIVGDNTGWVVGNSTYSFSLWMGNGTNRGIFDHTNSRWMLYADASDVYLKGLADRAAQLETARTIRTNLASTSAVGFDGTANVTPGVTGTLGVGNGGTGQTNLDAVTVGKAKALNTARTVRTNLASTSVASFDGTVNISPGVTGTLPVTNGGTGQTNLDLVTVGKAKALNTARNIQTNLASTTAASFNGTANVAPGVAGTLAVTNGGTGQTNLDLVTVGKAKALNTARNINGTPFDGTANITTATWGTARNVTIKDAGGTHQGVAVSVNGGTNVDFLLPSTITASLNGNADTASSAAKLTTARAINGTNFNGTAAITTEKWGKARNVTIKDATQTNTGAAVSVDGGAAFTLLLPATIKAALNGNADTATKLATARTINGTSFDGTSNITALESSARSFGESGYIKFQSGLIVQWGRSNFNSEEDFKDVPLPIKFTSNLYWAMGADCVVASATSVGTHAVAWSKGASTISTVRFLTGDSDTKAFVWIAIGV